MILNDPQTISDVTEIVKAYDKALVDNDLEAINQFFLGKVRISGEILLG
ncbi:TPA: AtzH-like domain-containing protein [Klebsiella quasipneumoniae]